MKKLRLFVNLQALLKGAINPRGDIVPEPDLSSISIHLFTKQYNGSTDLLQMFLSEIVHFGFESSTSCESIDVYPMFNHENYEEMWE